MKAYSQLIILFVLLFDISYSLKPKKEKYELPIVRNNKTNKNKNLGPKKPKGPNTRYFIYNIQDLFKRVKGDFLLFQVNSTHFSDISYTFGKKNGKLGDLNADYTWFIPNATFKQAHKIFSNQIAIYANRTDKSKPTLIIRVKTYFNIENVTCKELKNPSKYLKEKLEKLPGQKKNFDVEKHKHEKGRHHDVERKPKHDSKKHDWKKHDWKKHDWKNHDWKNHGHNKTAKDNRFKKDYKQKKYRKFGCVRRFFGFALFTIWIFLFILYCLVNRRKKTFVAELKNQQQVNLANYQNV